MMGSAAENEAIVHTSPQILTTSSNSQDQACDVEMLPVPQASSPELLLPLIVDEDMTTTTTASHDALLDQEFVVPFPDPTSTLDIHGFATSHQGVQGTSSSEQIAFRAASSVNHSEAVQPTNNISHGGGSTLNTSLANNPTMGHYPPRHLFNDPYEYELEKIRLEEDHLKKSFDEMTSQLMAELERKMAEARSQFERESQELDAKVMEVETNMGLVRTGSLLANAFVSKCSERSASNDLAAVRAAMISQQSTQQQQTVQANTQMSSTAPPRVRPQQESTRMSTTSAPPRPSVTSLEAPILLNSLGPLPRHHPTSQPSPMSQQTVHTHMNSTAPPRPSVTPVEIPILNSPGPLPHLPRRTTAQTSLMSQQTHTHVNSTAPPPSPPSVTSVEPQTPTNPLRPLVRFPRTTTTQPSPLSQQASNTNVNSTPLPRPSSVTTTEALPLHSPLSNTPRPRPRPVISNLTPTSSSSTPAVLGPAPHMVRASAPHLGRRPAPHVRPFGSTPAPMSAPPPAAAAAAATHPRSSVQEQEQQQQQGRSNDGLVHLSDDD